MENLVKFAYKRFLRVAIIGAPNAGKSTLLNRLVRNEIACISKKVHTTRRNLLGVFTQNDTQIEFYDSPGVVTRQHLLKHRLESSLLIHPELASSKCDYMAVVVDASNIREQKRLNKGVLRLLHDHGDKKSFLIMNKVDLVKDKRSLLDISTRLTQGCLEGHLTISQKDMNHMPRKQVLDLNLSNHLRSKANIEKQKDRSSRLHKYVIDLEPEKGGKYSYEVADPDSIGYKNFSHVFSISALNDDGVENLRDFMVDQAKPVDAWPHEPEFITNLSARQIVGEIIRGRVLDYVEGAVPYLVKYNYEQCQYDDMGSMHIDLCIQCPKKYMVSKVVGEKGVIVFRIIEDSRDLISKTLGCDVKLNIRIEHAEKRLNSN